MNHAEAINRAQSTATSRKRRNPRQFRRGIALVWTALMLIVMIGIVGLSIDWGWGALDAHWLQNAADAAALSGAMNIKKAFNEHDLDSAFEAARTLAMANNAAGSPVDVHYDAATNNPDLDVVVGQWFMSTRHFEPLDYTSTDLPNAVKVVTRHVEGWNVNQALPLNFGAIFGVQTIDVWREAIAVSIGGGGAALVCLDPDHPGIEIVGTTRLYVNAGPVPGEIYVNSTWSGSSAKDNAVYPNSASAPSMVGGWCIDCAGMNVVGTVADIVMDYFGTPPDDHYPILEGVKPIPDPLAWLPALNPLPDSGTAIEVDPATGEPAPGAYVPVLVGGLPLDVTEPITHTEITNYGTMIAATGRHTLTLIPGYYSGGISVPSSGGAGLTIRMLPGVYALGGGPKSVGAEGVAKSGLQFNGGALDALGVMIYLTESIEGNYGSVDLASYEYINMTEYEYIAGDPDYYRDYANPPMGAGMCIFQDRSSPMNANITAGGGGMNMTMGGTLYFHNDSTWDIQIAVGGSSGDTGIQLITDRVLIHGNGNITIKYDGRNFQPDSQALIVK
jgi:Flp pilus assembly protein TadG